MKNSKLVSILKTFSTGEFKEFGKFVESPFFSTGRNLVPLYSLLKEYYPSFDSAEFNAENVFRRLYHDRPFSEDLYRRLLSDLTKLAETYLSYIGFHSSGIENELSLLHEYNRRGSESLFRQKLKDAKEMLRGTELSGDFYRYNERILESERHFNVKFSQQKNESIVSELSTNILTNSLMRIENILHDTFVNSVDFNQNRGGILNMFVRNLNVEKLIRELNSDNEAQEIVKIYLYGIKLLSFDFNDSDYSWYKDLVKKYIKRFERTGRLALIFTLNDYIFKRTFETGETRYYEEAFDLYEMLFSKDMNIYDEFNNTTVINFRSAVIIANRLGKTEWIKRFVDENLVKLAPEFRDNIKHFAFAHVSFAERDYERTLNEINNIKFELFTFKLDAKFLTVQVYYEMGYTEQVLSSIDSFKHFMNENTNISELFKKKIEPFIKAAYELVMLRENYEEVKAGMFKQRLADSYEYAGKNWINEKLDELVSVKIISNKNTD